MRTTSSSVIGPCLSRLRRGVLGTYGYPRPYATQTSLGTTSPASSGSKHKPVTVFNDDGRIRWGDLTPIEKAARTTQQTFNFTLIIGGAAATIAVFALLYTDVFSPDSATVQFNKAVDSIRADARAVELLGGPGKDIRGFGEASWNKWRRNRPIASRTETDRFGTERLYMHFNVSGSKAEGVVQLHIAKTAGRKSLPLRLLGSRHCRPAEGLARECRGGQED